MQTLLKTAVIAALSIMLIDVPAMAMPESAAHAPLGSILEAQRAHEIFDSTFSGATIYDGDLLETQEHEALRARLGKSQIYLQQDTTAQVHALPNGYLASLLRGSVIVSSSAGQTFELFANGATIRAVGLHVTVARVTRVSASELLLTSNLGAIQVSYEGDVKTIEAGNSYRMIIQPVDSDPQDNGDHGAKRPVHGGRNKRPIIWISLGAAAAGAGIGVWRAVVSSP